MLVLSRQKDETIILGDQITITIVEIYRDEVHLVTVLPKCIHRSHEKDGSIIIDNEVKVIVTGVYENQVQLGIDAPKERLLDILINLIPTNKRYNIVQNYSISNN